MIPTGWTFALLALAAVRAWWLLAADKILDRPRARLSGRLSGLHAFLTCPWCLGLWITAVWWTAWQLWPHATLVVAGLAALSAVVGFLGLAIFALYRLISE